MKSLRYTFAIVFSFICLNSSLAQTQTKQTEKLSLSSGTIDNQFEFIIQKSYTYRGNGKIYKNVERPWLYALKAHTLDSLKAIKKNLVSTQNIVKTQASEITTLKTSLSNTQGTLDQTNLEKDSMNLFGMQMRKGGYNTLMWSIIGGLLAFLLFFIYKFKNSNSVTKQAKLNLEEIETEFEDHRRNALEREQKVRRQLQDELNKQKGV
jgi:uncharacterized integral membrane protein